MTVEQFNQADKLINKIEFLEGIDKHITAGRLPDLLRVDILTKFGEDVNELVPILTEPIKARLAELKKQFEEI